MDVVQEQQQPAMIPGEGGGAGHHHMNEGYRVLSKREMFDIDFMEGCERAINYPTVFPPYWVSLAGQCTIDHAAALWESAHRNLEGGEVTITPELREVWDELARMFTEVHATMLRCWLRWNLKKDTERKRLTFATGDDWEDHKKAIYFTRIENIHREEPILRFASSGCFGVYFKTVSECYDMMKDSHVVVSNDDGDE